MLNRLWASGIKFSLAPGSLLKFSFAWIQMHLGFRRIRSVLGTKDMAAVCTFLPAAPEECVLQKAAILSANSRGLCSSPTIQTDVHGSGLKQFLMWSMDREDSPSVISVDDFFHLLSVYKISMSLLTSYIWRTL